MKEKGFTTLEIVLVVAVLVVAGFAGWTWWQSQQATPAEIAQESTEATYQESEGSNNSPPESWVKYKNTERGYSFYYPDNAWVVSPLEGHRTVQLLKEGTGYIINFSIENSEFSGASSAVDEWNSVFAQFKVDQQKAYVIGHRISSNGKLSEDGTKTGGLFLGTCPGKRCLIPLDEGYLDANLLLNKGGGAPALFKVGNQEHETAIKVFKSIKIKK